MAAPLLPYSSTPNTLRVFSELPTTLIVTTNASWLRASPNASCSLRGLSNPIASLWLDDADDKQLNPLSLPGVVLNATAMSCTTPATIMGQSATVSLTLNGVNFSAPSPPITMLPAIEVAVGRRPYVTEQEGSLIIRPSAWLAGQDVRVVAWLGLAGTPLLNGSVQGGATTALPIDLRALPAELTDAAVVAATLPDGTRVTRSVAFVRARPPPAEYTGSVWQVDHRTRGLRANGLPFVALGWFGTPFSTLYRQLGAGDPSDWQPGAATARVA